MAPNDSAPARRLAHVPALDGLRAVAVTMVLLFHGGWSWQTGGYVGVSLFFTLSGYLITALLLAEHADTGRVAFGAFYARRVRRLLPASLVCLIGVVVFAAAGSFRRVGGLAGDVVASALQVANWRVLAEGRSYAEAIGAAHPSPLEHMWSLAIEEQFYWLWPLAVALLLRTARSRRSRIVAVGLCSGLFALAPVVTLAGWGADAVYWATPARLAEILVGALLAVIVHGRTVPRRLAPFGWVGLAVVVVAAVTWPSGSGPAYQGWLPVFAVASASAVAAACVPGSFATLLSWRPFVDLGRISYGVYLYHWPVFVLLDAEVVGGSEVVRFVVRVAVTLAVAVLSFRFVEQPIRHGTLSHRRVIPAAAAVTLAVVVAALVVVPDTDPGYATSVDPGEVALTPPDETGTDSSEPIGASAIRLVVLGDSTAVALAAGVVDWAEADLSRARVAVAAEQGCGLTRTRSPLSDDALNAACTVALGEGLDEVLRARPDVALVMVGLADTHELEWSADEGVLEPQDERFAARLLADQELLLERLVAAGVERVDWVLAPTPADWWLGFCCTSPDDPARGEVALFNERVLALAARHPELVTVHRLDEWLAVRESSGDRSWRPDGLHLGTVGARRVMDEFLGPLLLEQR